jgi:hypothetical protein
LDSGRIETSTKKIIQVIDIHSTLSPESPTRMHFWANFPCSRLF